jgi:hypothetical protein
MAKELEDNVQDQDQDQSQDTEQDQGQDQDQDQDQDPQDVIAGLQTALEAERQKSKNAEDLVELYKAQGPQRSPQPQQPQQPAVDPAFQGKDDQDIVTFAELKEIMGVKERQFGQVVTELDMAQRNSDYYKVVNDHLPNVIKKNPNLIMAIKTSQNPYVLAYELGKTDPKYKESAKGGGNGEDTEPSKDAGADVKKIIDNASKPGSPSSVAARRGLSQVSIYQQMSPDDIEKRIAEIKSRE